MRCRLSLILFAVVLPVCAQAQTLDTTGVRLRTYREGYCLYRVIDTVRQELVTKAMPCEDKRFDLAEWTGTDPKVDPGVAQREWMRKEQARTPTSPVEEHVGGEVGELFRRLDVLNGQCRKRCDKETHHAYEELWRVRRWCLNTSQYSAADCSKNIEDADAMEELLSLQLERPEGWKQRRKAIKVAQGWSQEDDCAGNVGAPTSRCP